MPDLRKDPILGRWVIVAKNRAKRPHDFPPSRRCIPAASARSAKETNTPRPARSSPIAIPARTPTAKAGECASCRTSFPRLEIEGDLQKRGEGIYDMMRGVGAHEVIIESPKHVLSTSDLTEKQLREVLWVYRDRLADLKKDRRLVYGMIFKNVGAGGRSVAGAHAQPIDRHCRSCR